MERHLPGGAGGAQARGGAGGVGEAVARLRQEGEEVARGVVEVGKGMGGEGEGGDKEEGREEEGGRGEECITY